MKLIRCEKFGGPLDDMWFRVYYIGPIQVWKTDVNKLQKKRFKRLMEKKT